MGVEPRVIEDDGGDTFSEVSARTINDADKLERLERNLEKAQEMMNVGNETSTEQKDGESVEAKSKNKRQKKKKNNDSGDAEVMYAPSIDEVTTDNDHLASLRGEGRYFGVADPDVNEPVCSNCHRRGHRRSQCKVVVCHACGKVDDHYETQCPNSMVCSNCGEKGHFRNNCPSKRTQTYCVECDSRNHSSDRCPSIWRSYVLAPRTKNSKMAYPSSKIFCYNCADKGHYGDDCPQLRVSKTPNINGSAFSGDNLPKELIGQYKNIQNRDHHSNSSRKRTFDSANSTNYNYAPPPYPRFNRNNGHTNNNNSYNYNNNRQGNNRIPTGPSKVGYIPMRNNNNNQNQRRNPNNYNGGKNNNNSYSSKTSYFNNNRNFTRSSRY